MPRSGLVTYANRGLAGIDGNISTALGVATQHSESYAVIGDLAFLHDISALANPTKDNLTIIVVDNNGGGIFSTLGQRGVKALKRFLAHRMELIYQVWSKALGSLLSELAVQKNFISLSNKSILAFM